MSFHILFSRFESARFRRIIFSARLLYKMREYKVGFINYFPVSNLCNITL